MRSYVKPEIILGVWISTNPKSVSVSRNSLHTPASTRNIAWLVTVRRSRMRLSSRVSTFTLANSWNSKRGICQNFSSCVNIVNLQHFLQLRFSRQQKFRDRKLVGTMYSWLSSEETKPADKSRQLRNEANKTYQNKLKQTTQLQELFATSIRNKITAVHNSLDGQHQDVARTLRGRVNQNDKRTGINGKGTSMVWPTLGSRTAKEQNSTQHWLGFIKLSNCLCEHLLLRKQAAMHPQSTVEVLALLRWRSIPTISCNKCLRYWGSI